jgi:FAD/FMN-containing dehydrogenase
MGMTVPNNSVVVCTQGFDRIHVLNAREQWVKVDCGVTIADLNEAIVAEGFRYPLENTFRKLTTIGSLLARNGMSRHSQLYGKALDTVIELEVMDGTGKFFTVTKDFEEYIGNEGSIFIILRAKLKVVPIKERSADIFFFDSVSQAVQTCWSAAEKKPLAIEFLDSIAATYAGLNTRHTVIVEYEGDQGAIKYENYLELTRKREAVRKNLGIKGYIHIEDGQVSQEHLEQAINWCREKELPVVCHAGLGVVHPFLKREQEKLREEWAEYLTKSGQNAAGQFGYGLRKKKYVPTGTKNRIRKLKERYDYNNVLCRGKLYDYI